MATDCGLELKPYGVTMLSLSLGPVKTELITALTENPEKIKEVKYGLVS